QILTQVAGRAGRGDQAGRVLVQTYRPTHYAIRFAVAHDFTGFAEHEVRYRESLGYPPYSKLANVRFDGTDASRVEALARGPAAVARFASVSMSIPTPCFDSPVKGRYVRSSECKRSTNIPTTFSSASRNRYGRSMASSSRSSTRWRRPCTPRLA